MIPGQLWRVHTEADRNPGPLARINWAAPASRGLVGCWLFNEGAGLPRDMLREAFPLLVSNSPSWAAGGMRFDGAQYLRTLGPVCWGAPCSIVARLSTPVGGANNFIYSEGNTGTNTPFLGLRFDGTDKLGLGVRIDTGAQYYTSLTARYADGLPHLMAGVVDAPTHTVYMDSQSKSLDYSMGGAITLNCASIGAQLRAGIGYYITGIMHSLCLYSRALTADEIAADYAEPWGQGRYLVPLPTSIHDMAEVVAYIARLSDQFALSDGVRGLGSYRSRIIDQISITEDVRGVGSYRSRIAEQLAITDSTRGIGSYVGRLSESLGVSASVRGVRSLVARLSDQLAITESVRGLRSCVARLADQFALTEAVRGTRSLVARLSDQLAVTGRVSGVRSLIARISDQFAITDRITARTGAVRRFIVNRFNRLFGRGLGP